MSKPDPYALVAAALECDVATLTPQTGLGLHPSWDSFGHAAVIAALETEYGIEINDETIRRYQSMTQIVALADR